MENENIHVEESGVISIQPRYSQWANKFVGGEVVAVGAAAPAAKPAPRKKLDVQLGGPAAAAATAASNGYKVVSPLPGTITEVKVKVGDSVAVGDTVVILEAMKMQNNIDTENAGTVKEINCKQGDSVMEGTVLLVIE